MQQGQFDTVVYSAEISKYRRGRWIVKHTSTHVEKYFVTILEMHFSYIINSVMLEFLMDTE